MSSDPSQQAIGGD